MGSTDGDSDEMKSDGTLPTVTVSSFRMSKTEFTIGEAKALLRATTNQKLKDVLNELLAKNYNAENPDSFALAGANYQDASMICAALGGRLPTPAEIEYVAKHGSENRPYGVPRNELLAVSNREQVCGGKNQLKNAEGFCDIAGGLWEITAGEYTRNYDTITSQDPINNGLMSLMTPEALRGEVTVNFGNRVVEYRGGSWLSNGWFHRSADRSNGKADHRYYSVGFRCAWPQDS
jgi:formylglycine-generating enzyme required for sulfatase activity